MEHGQEMSPSASVAFVDQTGQLGGAELSLLDLVRSRKSKKRAVIFEEGPFVDELRRIDVDTQVCLLGDRAASVRKQSGTLAGVYAFRDLLDHQRRLKKALHGFDVVYANTPKALVTSAFASRGKAGKLVYHLHDILSASHFTNLNRKLLVTLANLYADCVIANSDAAAAAFKTAGGRSSLVSVVPNGFELLAFSKAIEQSLNYRQTIRGMENIGMDVPVVAVVGRVAAWKGQHVAIDAIARIPNVQLWIVGDALFGEDKEYMTSLRRQVEELRLVERVIFMGHRTDVLPILQAADVIVHCSISPEPFGRVIVEAMLSRSPIVASRAGGAMEIIEDGKTGRLTQPGNVQELADCICSLVGDSSEKRRMLDAAQASASERYSLNVVADKINQMIDNVAHGQPAGV
jgi:glycosyltransferase involved in cell wall biosynthesis